MKALLSENHIRSNIFHPRYFDVEVNGDGHKVKLPSCHCGFDSTYYTAAVD